MQKDVKIKPTKWRTIEVEFGHLLLDSIQNGPSEMSRDIRVIKKVIRFIFGGKMYCTEVIKDGYIDYFHYDLVDDNGNELIKFHSEPHSQTKHQTVTEPFHLHVRENLDDIIAKKRLPNHRYRTLYDIMTYIEDSRHTSPLFSSNL